MLKISQFSQYQSDISSEEILQSFLPCFSIESFELSAYMLLVNRYNILEFALAIFESYVEENEARLSAFYNWSIGKEKNQPQNDNFKITGFDINLPINPITDFYLSENEIVFSGMLKRLFIERIEETTTSFLIKNIEIDIQEIKQIRSKIPYMYDPDILNFITAQRFIQDYLNAEAVFQKSKYLNTNKTKKY